MRRFIILLNSRPLSPGGTIDNGIFFTKEAAEERINNLSSNGKVEIHEISSIPVKTVTNKVSIV